MYCACAFCAYALLPAFRAARAYTTHHTTRTLPLPCLPHTLPWFIVPYRGIAGSLWLRLVYVGSVLLRSFFLPLVCTLRFILLLYCYPYSLRRLPLLLLLRVCRFFITYVCFAFACHALPCAHTPHTCHLCLAYACHAMPFLVACALPVRTFICFPFLPFTFIPLRLVLTCHLPLYFTCLTLPLYILWLFSCTLCLLPHTFIPWISSYTFSSLLPYLQFLYALTLFTTVTGSGYLHTTLPACLPYPVLPTPFTPPHTVLLPLPPISHTCHPLPPHIYPCLATIPCRSFYTLLAIQPLTHTPLPLLSPFILPYYLYFLYLYFCYLPFTFTFTCCTVLPFPLALWPLVLAFPLWFFIFVFLSVPFLILWLTGLTFYLFPALLTFAAPLHTHLPSCGSPYAPYYYFGLLLPHTHTLPIAYLLLRMRFFPVSFVLPICYFWFPILP